MMVNEISIHKSENDSVHIMADNMIFNISNFGNVSRGTYDRFIKGEILKLEYSCDNSGVVIVRVPESICFCVCFMDGNHNEFSMTYIHNNVEDFLEKLEVFVNKYFIQQYEIAFKKFHEINEEK